MLKPCSKCGESKPLSEYHKMARSKDGHQPRCKDCAKQLARDWYYANRDRALAAAKVWHDANPDKTKKAMRKHKVKRKYGLEWDEYESLIAVRGEVCWICGTEEAGGGRERMSVDHDHATGQVRGLLCDNCNNGIAKMHDDVDRLRSAAEYLRATA